MTIMWKSFSPLERQAPKPLQDIEWMNLKLLLQRPPALPSLKTCTGYYFFLQPFSHSNGCTTGTSGAIASGIPATAISFCLRWPTFNVSFQLTSSFFLCPVSDLFAPNHSFPLLLRGMILSGTLRCKYHAVMSRVGMYFKKNYRW